MGVITRGVAKIEVGDVAVDGGPGTTLDILGYSDRDSPVTQVEADPTLDRLYAHEIDTPLDTEVTGGEMPFIWTVVDPDVETLAAIFGGTVTGTGDTATYGLPSSKSMFNKTVKITPKKGLVCTIVNAAFYGKINADYAKAGKFAVDCVAEPQQPTKADTAPVIYGPKV